MNPDRENVMLAELAAIQNTAPAAELRIEPLHDEALIASTLRHPRIWPHISDDSCSDPLEFQVPMADAILYLGVYDRSEYIGLFMLHPHNFILYEVHTALLPRAWGLRAHLATKACARWMFENTRCQRIVTCVPDGNVLALRLALKAGMSQYGRNPRSLLRGGVLVDQILLGLNKD